MQPGAGHLADCFQVQEGGSWYHTGSRLSNSHRYFGMYLLILVEFGLTINAPAPLVLGK